MQRGWLDYFPRVVKSLAYRESDCAPRGRQGDASHNWFPPGNHPSQPISWLIDTRGKLDKNPRLISANLTGQVHLSGLLFARRCRCCLNRKFARLMDWVVVCWGRNFNERWRRDSTMSSGIANSNDVILWIVQSIVPNRINFFLASILMKFGHNFLTFQQIIDIGQTWACKTEGKERQWRRHVLFKLPKLEMSKIKIGTCKEKYFKSLALHKKSILTVGLSKI